MYYPVAVINPKAAQICLLCLYNFPPKLQYLKDSNAEIKRKKNFPTRGYFKFLSLSSWSIWFPGCAVVILLVRKKPSRRSHWARWTSSRTRVTQRNHLPLTLPSLPPGDHPVAKTMVACRRSPVLHIQRADRRESFNCDNLRRADHKLNFPVWI